MRKWMLETMNIRKKYFASLVVGSFLATFLSGCTSSSVYPQSMGSSYKPDQRSLPFEVGRSLSANPGDISITVNEGDYQGQILTALPAYSAASGRQCRRVLLNSSATEDRFTACRYGESQWELVRSILLQNTMYNGCLHRC